MENRFDGIASKNLFQGGPVIEIHLLKKRRNNGHATSGGKIIEYHAGLTPIDQKSRRLGSNVAGAADNKKEFGG